MSDGDALLRAILEHPADDAPRLVFADWLDEYGDAGRAELIRWQVARPAEGITALKALDNRAWDLLFTDPCAGPFHLSAAVRAGLPDPGLKSSEQVRYEFRRGLVSGVWLTQAALAELAGPLFRRHPITAVRPWDAAPHWDGGAHCWFGDGGAQRKAGAAEAGVLAPFFAHLPGRFKRRARFATPEDALDALSRACVAYGRNLAGLPPLT